MYKLLRTAACLSLLFGVPVLAEEQPTNSTSPQSDIARYDSARKLLDSKDSSFLRTEGGVPASNDRYGAVRSASEAAQTFEQLCNSVTADLDLRAESCILFGQAAIEKLRAQNGLPAQNGARNPVDLESLARAVPLVERSIKQRPENDLIASLAPRVLQELNGILGRYRYFGRGGSSKTKASDLLRNAKQEGQAACGRSIKVAADRVPSQRGDEYALAWDDLYKPFLQNVAANPKRFEEMSSEDIVAVATLISFIDACLHPSRESAAFEESERRLSIVLGVSRDEWSPVVRHNWRWGNELARHEPIDTLVRSTSR